MNTPGVKCWVFTQFFVGPFACDLVQKSNQMVPVRLIEKLEPGYGRSRVELGRAVVEYLQDNGHVVAAVLATKYARPTPPAFGGTGGISMKTGSMWVAKKDCYKNSSTLHVRIVHPCALYTQSEKLGGKGANRVAALVREIETYVATYSGIVASKKSVR